MAMGGCYHQHRPGSILASTPFIETLPTPHTVHPIPPPLPADSGILDPNYYANYPCYKFDSAPYVPQHLRPLVENDDPGMYCVSNQMAHAWTRPSWGWVAFRTDNSISNEEWAKVRRRIWERYKFQSYSEPEKFRILWVALDLESQGELEGKESLAEFEVVRRTFQQWLTTHKSDPAYESYDPNFCLIADTRSCQEILCDIESRPTLPEEDPSIKASRTDVTLIVLDRRTPENPTAQPDDTDEAETEFWDAEGQYDEKGYKGYLRSSVDDVAFLWGDVGNGDPQEVVFKYERKARVQPGGVFTYWHCT